MRHTRSSTFDNPIALGRQAGAAMVPATRPPAWRRWVRLLGWCLGLPGRIAVARRDMAQLGGMTDRELADIGLARHDLRDATALRIGEAPSALLRARVEARRHSRPSRT